MQNRLNFRNNISLESLLQVAKSRFVAGPDIWNSLPPEIRLTENFPTFKKLKTHLFHMAFS